LPIAYAIKFKNLSHETVFQANFWLLDTVIKGFVFLIYQAYEYTSCMFSINDSVYGAVFFTNRLTWFTCIYRGYVFVYMFNG
jgi:heme/copper-type cytochrome/quinol oxidase subunit 3